MGKSRNSPQRGSSSAIGTGERITGVVKWFNAAKGYGFINRDDGEADVFCHFSAIRSEGFKELVEGDKVEFAVAQAEKGPAAEDVVKL